METTSRYQVIEEVLKQGAHDGQRMQDKIPLEKKLAVRASVEARQGAMQAVWQELDKLPADEYAVKLKLLLAFTREKGIACGLSGLRTELFPKNITKDFLSVVIPNLNGFPHLKTTLKTLVETDSGPTEIIIVDNGSRDGSAEWLAEQGQVRLIRLSENRGAPTARNIGLAEARGEHVLFCDNDVVFTPGWRDKLLMHMGAWEDIGIVGPISDNVSGSQKVEGLPAEGLAGLAGVSAADFAARITQGKDGYHGYTSRLILFFMLVRRSVVQKIGGIDEAFNPWGFEDDDYCLRARVAGFQLRVARDCFIQHLGSQTAKSANLNYQRLLLEKWAIYKKKWELPQDLPYGASVDLNAIVGKSWPQSQLWVPFLSGEEKNLQRTEPTG